MLTKNKEVHMKLHAQYRLVTSYHHIVGTSGEYSWRVTDTKPLSPNKDNVRIRGLGDWVHDKATGECSRLVSTKYRRVQLANKMTELEVPLDRVDEISFEA